LQLENEHILQFYEKYYETIIYERDFFIFY